MSAAQHSSAEEINALARAAAVVDTSPEAQARLTAAFDHTQHWTDHDWDTLIRQLELNGLSPLFYWHLTQLQHSLPPQMSMQLKALSVRHRRAHEIRTRALVEIIDTLGQHAIPFALLKGAALAHLLYPRPRLRPMGDIDILVPPDQAEIAQQALIALGYKESQRPSEYLAKHHHLPSLTRMDQNMTVMVEIHRDALSGDVASSIQLDSNSDRLAFDIELDDKRYSAFALPHHDALAHLCHHAFEPAETIKLISLADLVGYADAFQDDIDWPVLALRAPYILNALRCTAYLLPLPARFMDNPAVPIRPAPRKAPSGVGKGFVPLSRVSAQPAPLWKKLATLVNPSPWWLHVFYNVPPENSLFLTRWVRHPFQLLKWFGRRHLAAWSSHRAHRTPPP